MGTATTLEREVKLSFESAQAARDAILAAGATPLLGRRLQEDALLDTILTESRKIATCEGGSLYLADRRGEEPTLVFKLAQNDAFDVPFVETRLPMTSASIAGHVATIGEELNIADVYALEPMLPYRFNRSFDDKIGYRTSSMLVMPMRDHRQEVVGVLQFVNRRDRTGGLAALLSRWQRVHPLCTALTHCLIDATPTRTKHVAHMGMSGFDGKSPHAFEPHKFARV